MSKSSAKLMTEGSIWKRIVAFAIPLFWGNLFQQLYNTADSLIVGNFLGSSALAAVSSSGNLIFLMVGLFNGIAIGSGVIVAKYYGARDIANLQKSIHTTVGFGLICGVILTIVGIIAAPQILVLMGTPEAVLPNSITYFRIYFTGSLAFVMYNFFVGILQSGAVWLDPKKTSPFEFYQYWRNVADADVLKCLRMLTFLPLEQIDEMDKWEGAQLNTAKEILAFELTKLVHGEEEATKAQEGARALFSSGNAADMPTAELSDEDFADGSVDILTLLHKSGLVASKSEARRAVQQGGVAVDGEKVSDIATTFTKADFEGEGKVVRKGKKNFRKVIAK